MRKLVVLTFLTLDGVMQAPGGPEEDPVGGFTLGGWSVNHWDGSMEEVMSRRMAPPFDLLLGRKTYEIFAGYWPFATEPGADEAAFLRRSQVKPVQQPDYDRDDDRDRDESEDEESEFRSVHDALPCSFPGFV